MVLADAAKPATAGTVNGPREDRPASSISSKDSQASSKTQAIRIVYIRAIGNRRRPGLRPFVTKVFRVERIMLEAA
jgi:hypothetical protein